MPFNTGLVNTSPTGTFTSAVQFSNFDSLVGSFNLARQTVKSVLLEPLPVTWT